MPLIPNLTPELKREILRLKGLSPEQGYDVLDTGQIVQNPNPQPSVDVNSANSVVTTGNNDVLSRKPPGSLESFGRAAATSTIPTFSAFGAVAATPAIAAAIAGAPLTGGASLLLPILAGVGTAAGASYLQDKLVPESVKQQLFTRPEDIAENPKATFAGGLAPSALAFNPVRSLGDVRTLVSGAKKLPTLTGITSPGTIPLTTQEVIALQNAGINAGISVAQEGYEQLAHDDFSLGRLAANAIAPTLLFTRPTKLGQRVFGFHDIPEGPMYGRTETQAPAQGEPLQPAESAQYAIPPEVTQSGYVPGGVLIRDGEIIPLASVKKDFKPGDVIRYKDPQTGKTVEYVINEDYQRVPQYQDSPLSQAPPADETIVGTPTPRKPAPGSAEVIEQERRQPSAETKAEDYKTSLREKAQQDLIDEQQRAQQALIAEQQRTIAALAELTTGTQVARPEQRPQPRATTELGKEIYPDYTGVTEYDAAELARQPRQTEAERVEQEYEKGIRRSEASALPPEESPVGPRFGNRPVREYPPEVQAAFKRLEDLEAEVRGIKLQRETQGTGQGQYDPPIRTTSLRPTYAGDIAGHETIGHGYILDMLASRSKKDRDFTWRGIREFSEVPAPKTLEEFLALPDAERARIEEGIAKALGVDSFNRKKLELYGTKRERFLNWWADTRSALKYHMGIADSSDVLRSLGFGGKYAAPYGTRPEFMPRTAAELAAQGGVPAGVVTSARQQGEGVPADAARMAQVSALSAKGRALEEQGMTFDRTEPTETDKGVYKLKTPEGKIASKLFYDKESPTETRVDWVDTKKPYRGQGYAETLYRELANVMQQEGATDLTGNLISDKAADIRERVFDKGEYTAKGKPVSFEEAKQILRDKPTMVKARHRVDPNERYSQESALGPAEATRTKEELQKAFGEVGSEQRGTAESLGTGGKAVEKFGGAYRLLQGSLNYNLEHVGDLIHRLSSHNGPAEYWPAVYTGGGEAYGRDAALSKTKDALRHLETYVKPNGGLEAYTKAVAQNNDKWFKKEGKKYAPDGLKETFDENWQDIKGLLTAYADEHAKLKPASELQKIANDATIALGRLDTKTYESKLKELKTKLESDNWLEHYYTDVNKQTGSSSRLSQESALKPAAEPIRGTDYDTTRPLYLTASKVLSSQKELGLNPASKFPQYQLNATLKSKLPPVEYEMLQEAGLDKFLAESKSLTPKELQTWIEENGPRVDIVSYGMNRKASPAAQELDALVHWFDTYAQDININIENETSRRAFLNRVETGRERFYPDLTDEQLAKIKRFDELVEIVRNEPRSTSPHATSTYKYVSAFAADEPMPDWTTSKDSKNVQRVDLVLPLQKRASDMTPEEALYLADYGKEAYAKKYGKSELWQPDSTHENLPNTLGWAMLQYKTGPNGERIATVVEAQSRWGQVARRLGVRSKKDPLAEYAEYLDEQLGNKKVDYSSVPRKSIGDVIDANTSFLEIAGKEYKSPDKFFREMSKRIEGHPLLHDYNRLILKAAIDQARKEGATHIVISDAETAMLTEGHDATAGKIKRLPISELERMDEFSLINKFGSDWRNGKYVKYNDIPFRIDNPRSNHGMYDGEYRVALARELQPYADKEGPYIPQESGMRFNYDDKFWIVDKNGNKLSESRFPSQQDAKAFAENRTAGLGLKSGEYSVETGQLNKIAGELLGGQEGQRISLGEHKNAYENLPAVPYENVRQEIQTLQRQQREGEISTQEYQRRFQELQDKYKLPATARDNLIFKDPETGTPKTDVSGRMYSLEGAPEKFSLTSKRFSEESALGPADDYQSQMENFKADFDEKLRKRQEEVRRIFEDSDIKVGDMMYTPSGNVFEVIGPATPDNKTGEPRVFVRSTGTEAGEYETPLKVKDLSYDPPSNLDKDQARYSTGSALPPSTEPIPERTGRRSFMPLLTSRFDKVAERHPNETGRYVSDAFHKWQAEADLLEGRIGNKAIALIKDYTPEEVQRVDRLRHALTIGEPAPYTLTANERRLKDAMDAHYRDVGRMHQDSGMLVRSADGSFRRMVLNEQGYRPSLLSNEVAYTWAENIQPKAREYDQMFIDHAMRRGETEESARNLLQDYKQAIGHAGATPDVKFGALRKVEGMGLPWALVDQNYTSMASRYGRRAAADLSFFKNVQNDPKMLAALPIRDQQGKLFRDLPQEVKDRAAGIEYIGGSEEVKQALRSVYGIDLPANPRLMSAARAVGSMVMQTGTAIRNLVQIPTSVAPYYGVDIITGLKALGKMNERTARAFENNAIRSSFKDFDAAGDFNGNPIRFIRYADKISEFLRKYTGRELSDKIEGLYHYSLGEELATKWFAQAKNRDIKARQMIKRFGNTLEKPVADYFNPATEVTADDIARVAKSFVDAARGTYSASGLPGVAMEGNVAPFLALSRWSIERSNIFWRDVVEPMKGGDFMPLLKTTFAALLTGAAIEQLNEALTGKRGVDPTLKEALADGDADTLTAKAIGLAQLGSYAGIVSDAAKVGSQLAQGKSIRYTNPLSMPMASAGVDIANRTAQVAKAIREGEDPFDALALYAKDLALATSQNARYAYGNLTEGGREEAMRKEKFRDLRVFEELTGRREGSSFTETNPYLGLGARNFKRSDDIAEALQMVPDLVQRAVDQSQDDNGQLDIEILRRKLRALKLNNYQTVPDALKNPRAFTEFMDFLSKTQGPEAATERATDFYRQRAINKMKTSTIPSF